jgi:hypothetical protein
MTVWIYVDTNKQVGDREHLKVFASIDAADTWLQENDPEGVVLNMKFLDDRIDRRVAIWHLLGR